ncbi:MAG: hypothetical protein SNJ77_12315, partial [Cytophagales bacterium]
QVFQTFNDDEVEQRTVNQLRIDYPMIPSSYDAVILFTDHDGRYLSMDITPSVIITYSTGPSWDDSVPYYPLEGAEGFRKLVNGLGSGIETVGSALQVVGKTVMIGGGLVIASAQFQDNAFSQIATYTAGISLFALGGTLDIVGGITEASGQLLQSDYNNFTSTVSGEVAGTVVEKIVEKRYGSIAGAAAGNATEVLVNKVVGDNVNFDNE